MFEGVRKDVCGVKYTGPGEFELVRKQVIGWLIPDGMSLLYLNMESGNV